VGYLQATIDGTLAVTRTRLAALLLDHEEERVFPPAALVGGNDLDVPLLGLGPKTLVREEKAVPCQDLRGVDWASGTWGLVTKLEAKSLAELATKVGGCSYRPPLTPSMPQPPANRRVRTREPRCGARVGWAWRTYCSGAAGPFERDRRPPPPREADAERWRGAAGAGSPEAESFPAEGRGVEAAAGLPSLEASELAWRWSGVGVDLALPFALPLPLEAGAVRLSFAPVEGEKEGMSF